MIDWSAVVSAATPPGIGAALVGLVVWLVRRVVKAADDRAELWKHLYDQEHNTVNILLDGVKASTVTAEGVQRVVTAIPVAGKEG